MHKIKFLCYQMANKKNDKVQKIYLNNFAFVIQKFGQIARNVLMCLIGYDEIF